MKCNLLFIALLWAIPVFSQQPTANTELQSADNQVFTLVVRDFQSFMAWAESQQINCTGAYRPANIVVLQTSSRLFQEKIRENPQVLFACQQQSPPKEELPAPGHNLFVNKINAAKARFPNLNGSESIVSIREFRFDSLDVDFKARVLPSVHASTNLTTHASIMATLIGGAGNSDLAGQGVAPGCKMVSSEFGQLLPEEDYAEQGVTVQNHAYGVDIENFYGPNALAYDQNVIDNPHLLHVFSSGNNGQLAPPSGSYANIPGFANMTGNFKMAKNVLTVGALDSTGQLTYFSSRGPAYDGRIKPDLTAFGHDGTSSAAALVSGAAAVLQQAYREKFGAQPAAALLRAILINAADDAGAPGPDFGNGFGSLNLENAIQTLVNHQFISETVAAGTTRSFDLNVPANCRQIKLTLTWDDLPAMPGASTALMNDLDLQLATPGGQILMPWVLNTAPSADSLALPALRKADHLNNTEQITLDFPAPGLYQIQVAGTTLVNATQAFAVAFSNDTTNHFEWTFPLKNDPVTAGKEAILQWDSNLPDSIAILEWKPIGQTEWKTISAATNLQAHFKRWLLPDTFAEAQVRMRVNSHSFISDTFLIASVLRMKIAFDCPDSVGLFWAPQVANARYLLYGLGEKYLEPLFQTRDTFLVLPKSLFPQQRFAVAPIGEGSGALGHRSASPDIAQQGVACYEKSFQATLNNDAKVDLALSLGSTYGLNKIIFEKRIGSSFLPLITFENIDNDQFTYTDTAPQQGANIYRASLQASNGGQIISDTATVWFSGKNNWLVFPNPAISGSSIQILTPTNGEAKFRLYNLLGQLLLDIILEETNQTLQLPQLPKGAYFFETTENKKQLMAGILSIH